MSVLSVCEWLQNLPWASGVKHSAWQFPVVESIHSLALSAMLWPAAILDLRLLGLIMPRRSVSEVAAQFLPWVWSGFTIMILSGAMLFASEAVKCYHSPFFRTKLVLLGAALVHALVTSEQTPGSTFPRRPPASSAPAGRGGVGTTLSVVGVRSRPSCLACNRHPSSRAGHPGPGAATCLDDQPMHLRAYQQTNLVSDFPVGVEGVNAQIQDTNLLNPWGLVASATSPFWVSNQVSGVSTLYSVSASDTVAKVPLTRTFP